MSKIALITDSHLGVRNGSRVFRQYMEWWWGNQFFPKCRELDIQHIYHGGDFFDARTSIKLEDIQYAITTWKNDFESLQITMDIIPGNHDVAYKNTNEIHSLHILTESSSLINVHQQPTVQSFGDYKLMLVPWINSSNAESIMTFIRDYDDKANTYILGHFEIVGMQMYRGTVCEHGLEQTLFEGYRKVFSGHFHEPNSAGNITYLGAPFHMTWQDYGCKRGWYVYDTVKDDFEFIENDTSLFVAIELEDDVTDFSVFEGCYVRVYCNEEFKQTKLLDLVNNIQNAKPIEVQIIDNYTTSSKSVDPTTKNTIQTGNIIDYFNTHIDENYDKKLKIIMTDVYDRAVNEMNKGE